MSDIFRNKSDIINGKYNTNETRNVLQQTKQHFYFKAAVRKFSSLSPSLFENLQLYFNTKANYAPFEQVVFKNTNIFWSQAICNQMHI